MGSDIPPPHSTPARDPGLDSRLAVFGFLCLCLTVLFFAYLNVADPSRILLLTREDSWVENLTAGFLLVAGLLLFVTASADKGIRRGIYMLGGLALLFGAGEEISWGQRLFGFTTPEFLKTVNAQDEFNVHNISIQLVVGAVNFGTVLLCLVTSAAFFCRQRTVLGIPVPSLPLLFGFLVMDGYWLTRRGPVGWEMFFNPSFLSGKDKILLFLFVIYSLLSRQPRLFMVAGATVTLVLASSYINMYHEPHGLMEVKEYLFGLLCLFYSGELWLAQGVQGRGPASFRVSFAGLNRPAIRTPFLLTMCSLVMAGSIGLVFFEYFGSEYRALYSSISSGTIGDPVVRSDFDVYLLRDRLIYFKEPCAPADIEARFFVHVIPADANDLPDDRKPHGFDNLDFIFRWPYFHWYYGDLLSCMRVIPLPDYDVDRIRTGQYVPGKGEIWSRTFPFPPNFPNRE